MRFSFASTLVVSLAAQGTIASSWFGKPGAYLYNKWHETELERWLSDHNVPYPTPYDRKQLEDLVKTNWNDKVVTPYNSWDAQTLQNYLTLKGKQAQKGTEKNTDKLVEQVKSTWAETEDSAQQAYGSIQNWIFDSWTDSQLKAFLDRNNIPAPQPRARDSLLKSARQNYQSAAGTLKEYYQYPGDWLYTSWSESDLKAWLDERGYPAPQPSSRDKLVASVRRNSRLASLNLQAAYASASSSAAAVQASLSDQLINAWSDTQIKQWADKNGIKVPQGSKRNELLALVRKHRASLLGDNVSGTAVSAYGAATSKAGNEYAQATAGFAYYTQWAKDQLGLGPQPATYSAKSATNLAYKSASSAASAASKSASSASAAGHKSAQKAYDAAAESAEKAKNRAAEAASKATDKVKEEL